MTGTLYMRAVHETYPGFTLYQMKSQTKSIFVIETKPKVSKTDFEYCFLINQL